MKQVRNRAKNLLKSALLILFGLTAVVGAFLLYDAPRPSRTIAETRLEMLQGARSQGYAEDPMDTMRREARKAGKGHVPDRNHSRSR